MGRSSAEPAASTHIEGAHAILGIDVVSFSKLHDDDQIMMIERLIEWINAALLFNVISEDQYRWSPAGDGGYLTFATTAACRKAVDVAFSICERAKAPQARGRNGEALELRLALHAGTVQEAKEFGKKTNIWGVGINTTARVLSLANPSQMLMSKQYFDFYIKDQREAEFEFGEPHWRTVKHDLQLEVLNANKGNLCRSKEDADALCWQDIGGLWRKTVNEYTYLIDDALRSGDSMAAIAAAKFLQELNESKPLKELCLKIGNNDNRRTRAYPLRDSSIFSQMSPDILEQVISAAKPQLFPKGGVICRQGDPAESCFFAASGAVRVDIPGLSSPTRITSGEIIGEFGLWIPNIKRTATLLAEQECLMLTISNDRFVNILKQDEHVAELIYNRIKDRILNNVRKSASLFPASVLTNRAVGSEIPAKCEMFSEGAELDLKSNLYVVFNGSVSIPTKSATPLVIKTSGIFGPETVVGITCDLGDPDGEKAIVQDKTVVVIFPREAIREMQKKSDEMSDLWNAIGGRRQGRILRNPTATPAPARRPRAGTYASAR